MKEIHDLSVEDETWIAKLTVLKENIAHDVKEEEKNLFPKIKQLLEIQELEEMEDYKEQCIEYLTS